jgi:hypothetical protein
MNSRDALEALKSEFRASQKNRKKLGIIHGVAGGDDEFVGVHYVIKLDFLVWAAKHSLQLDVTKVWTTAIHFALKTGFPDFMNIGFGPEEAKNLLDELLIILDSDIYQRGFSQEPYATSVRKFLTTYAHRWSRENEDEGDANLPLSLPMEWGGAVIASGNFELLWSYSRYLPLHEEFIKSLEKRIRARLSSPAGSLSKRLKHYDYDPMVCDYLHGLIGAYLTVRVRAGQFDASFLF